MKALSKFVATAVLLVTLATFPSAIIAFRPITATVPHFASPARQSGTPRSSTSRIVTRGSRCSDSSTGHWCILPSIPTKST